jgi:hypothetical protein
MNKAPLAARQRGPGPKTIGSLARALDMTIADLLAPAERSPGKTRNAVLAESDSYEVVLANLPEGLAEFLASGPKFLATITSADFSLHRVLLPRGVILSDMRRDPQVRLIDCPCTSVGFTRPDLWSRELCGHWPVRPGRPRLRSGFYTSPRRSRYTTSFSDSLAIVLAANRTPAGMQARMNNAT